MLQQTQVATVIPYYKKWLQVFPSLSVLARAPLSKALKYWAGLGYFRRVRMFHQAARHVQKNLGGRIPRTAEELKRLPGIGRYTAGAIASIAWNEITPVLDGNVIRILTRIFAVSQSVDRPETLKKLWDLAASLLPAQKPGDLNQALMELGATICFPLTPQCNRCPVRRNCVAHKKKKELVYPVRSRKDRYEKVRMAALVLQNPKGRVWLEKQPEHERWGGLWMFPFWVDKKKMLEEIQPLCPDPVLFLTVPHAFTKYRVLLEVYVARSDKSIMRRKCGKWLSLEELPQAALPSPHRKIAQALIVRKDRR